MKESKLLNILLINDDEDDSFILQEVAQYFSSSVVLDNICPEYRIAEKLDLEKLPDIIVLDLYMGRANGLDLLKQLTFNKSTRHIPVIIYSSRQHSSIVRKCFDLGASLFVEKPHTYKGVERMFRKIIAMDWNQYKTREREYNFILETEDY